MIDVKGTRSNQAQADVSDPLGLRQPEPGAGKFYSGWFVGLIALGLYIRSFLWPEPEPEVAAEEGPNLAGEDESNPALRKAAFDVPEGETGENPRGGSTGTGAAEPAQEGIGPFPEVLGPFDSLFFTAVQTFYLDSGFLPNSANTILPPFRRPDARAIGSDIQDSAPVGGGSAGGGGAPAAPRDEAPDEGDEGDGTAEEPRNRAPRNTGPVYLADVGSGAAVAFALSFFLSQSVDPDGDTMEVKIEGTTSGGIGPWGDGLRYIADTDFLGEVRIDYTVTDGSMEVAQTAYLNVVENELVGSDEDDLLVGTHGRDMIEGLSGDDNLAGLAGRDRIFGGHGEDNIAGGDGDDSLSGGDGDDMIVGGAGNDWISGGAGNDRLYGDLGDDEIHGDAGDDAAYGGEGDDTIYGGEGHDTLDGGAGDDVLSGDDGADLIHGGDGADVISGGTGDDTAFGGGADDVIFGDDGSDHLDGGEGDDVLSGDAGDDHLEGGAGEDVLTGGAGSDAVSGGAGDDVVIADDDAVADHFDGGDGHDQLDYSAATSAVIFDLSNGIAHGESTGEDGFENFEHIIGGGEGDSFYSNGGQGTLTGNGGEDQYIFVPGDTVDVLHSIYRITDFSADDDIWIGEGASRYHIRKEQKSLEDRIEEGFEEYAEGIGADEPRLSFHFDWTETYRRTTIEVDFDRDEVVDLEVMLDGEHVFLVEHA